MSAAWQYHVVIFCTFSNLAVYGISQRHGIDQGTEHVQIALRAPNKLFSNGGIKGCRLLGKRVVASG
ncbi:hypothetical protein KW843_11760 [Acidovorax sp. sif1233]|nr:hypothetical protein [Acidovorax sp. sif1233]